MTKAAVLTNPVHEVSVVNKSKKVPAASYLYPEKLIEFPYKKQRISDRHKYK